MGMNTDGKETGPGSTVTDGVELAEKNCRFKQETEYGSLPQDADGDVGIHERKRAKGSGIPPITSLQNMPSQHTSGALDTEHNEVQREHTDGKDRVLSSTSTLLRPDANKEDEKTELPHGTRIRNDILKRVYTLLLILRDVICFNLYIDRVDEEGYTPLYKAALEGHFEGVDDLILRGANPNKPSKAGLRPLHAAAQEGHAHIVDFLILQGADVNVECDFGQTPLHTAASNGYTCIVDGLIAEGANVNKEDNTGRTPFNDAVQYGHLEAVKCLMTKGAKPNRYDGMTPLYAATYFGHLDIVRSLVSKGADVNEEDDEGRIPLHGAASGGHLEVMEYLVQQGSDVDKGDAKDKTPFHAAVHNGHLKAVECLITEGAKQNKYDGMTPLFAAAVFGHLDLVEYFISKGADVNEDDEKGMVSLHGAAYKGNMKIMEYLIHQGSDVNKGDVNGWTPFNIAVQKGNLEAVKYLITKGAKQNRYASMTPLHAAAYFGHLDIVEFFISKRANVNEENDEGMISLHGAANQGHLKVMEYLIQQGSDVNKKDKNGCTPFNAAIQEGHLEAVNYLITKGVEQNRNDGMTPVYAAAYFGHLDIVKFFLSNGADVNEEDDRWMSPLHGAASGGHIEVIEYLIRQGSDVNKIDCRGWTPLLAAVKNGHLEVAEFFMAKGAKGTRVNGLTPLYIATQYDHIHVVDLLVTSGYDVNERNESGKSPLHAACYNGNMDIVKFLLRHNANVNEQDRDGWTPLEAAAQEGHQDIVEYLVSNGADMNVRDVDGLTPLRVVANTTKPHAIEGISPSRGDPDKEETGDPRSGGHQNIITRGYVTATMKDADKHSRTRQFASQVDNADVGNEYIHADIAKKGADEPCLRSLPTMTNDDEKGGNEEHNPFIHAKLKYPGKGEHDPMLDQMEAIMCTGTRTRDTTTNGTDCSSPHGSQTWQYSGFDPPYLQTMETDGHPSEKPRSRCHSPIDENREMRGSSSPITAQNGPPINGSSTDLESFPKHQPDVVRQKLYDGNPVSTQGTSSNPVRKFRTKPQKSVHRCPSILALVQTFLQMMVALPIFLAGSPVLVAGSGIIERVTLQAGQPGVVPFHLQWTPNSTSHGVPYYTLGFQSEPLPFCINGQKYIAGFKNPSQIRRFSTSVTNLDTSPCVNLMIDNVDILDEDGYVLTTVWHSFEDVWHKTMKKEIVVQIPPGPAKCFITLSGNSDYPYEVHCRATTGSVTTTLSCYQNDQKIDVRGDITDNGLITSGIFWLHDYTHFSCCSHDVTSHVNETTCNDFVWPSGKETTKQTINTDPTPVTTPTPQVEYHTGSGACRQFMLPSLWHFTYLSVYLLFYVLTMY